MKGEIDTDINFKVSQSDKFTVVFQYPFFNDYSKTFLVHSKSSINNKQSVLFIINNGNLKTSTFELRNPDNKTTDVVAERTICPILINNLIMNDVQKSNLTIQIFTESPILISVLLIVTIFDLEIKLYDNHIVFININKPVLFLFKFPANISTVSVTVKSDDDTCMTLSIQNSVCPIYENAKDVKNGDLYQAVTKIGSIVVQNENNFVNNQFFIVLVANGNNGCHNKTKLIHNNMKNVFIISQKKLEIEVKTIDTNYKLPIIFVIIFFPAFFLVYKICLYILSKFCQQKNTYSNGNNSQTNNINFSDEKWYKKHCINLEFILIISFFYAIPVVQFFLYHNTTLDITGNQNICFYNSLCTRPKFGFITFNNIFSNIGYVVLGILFLLSVLIKHKFSGYRENEIPLQFGIFYALGVSLIMEGIMSACYHICPRLKNIQFDATYMYIMASLLIMYYILRIKKITTNITYDDYRSVIHRIYLFIAFMIFIAFAGIMCERIKTVFIYLYIPCHFCLTFFFFRVNECGWEFFFLLKKIFSLTKFHDIEIKSLRLFLFINFVNIVVLAVNSSFYLLFLTILVVNSGLYFLSYVYLKNNILSYLDKCKIGGIFIIILALWGSAFIFFCIYSSTNWELSPAKSRELNRDCILFDFYDFHDVWHFISSVALFLTFSAVLSYDKDDKMNDEILMEINNENENSQI